MADHPESMSPKQLAKRGEIVAAAQRILVRDGPGQCTTRAVARESGLNQGLIYYYFGSMEDIVEAAMGAFADDLVAAIDGARDVDADVTDRYWALFEAYFGIFAEQPGLATAWFEYWIIATRSGRTDALAKVQDTIVEHLEQVLADTAVDNAAVRARLAMSYILGVLIRSWARPNDLAGVRAEIEQLAYAVLGGPAQAANAPDLGAANP
jgi:AcrR family transcriptional regulator